VDIHEATHHFLSYDTKRSKSGLFRATDGKHHERGTFFVKEKWLFACWLKRGNGVSYIGTDWLQQVCCPRYLTLRSTPTGAGGRSASQEGKHRFAGVGWAG
jgi:hypothetical protein